MFVPQMEKTYRLEIRKSVFIAVVHPVESADAVKQILRQRRDEHPKCSHVVWAYILGDEKSQLQGFSDDGEPKGTAGKPVLSVLQYSGLTNTLITVVRYFGGIKLGKGGLVKAYTGSAKGAAEAVPRKELRKETKLYIQCGYRYFDAVKAALEHSGAGIVAERFESDISLTVVAVEDGVEALSLGIMDATGGTAVITTTPP